MKKVFLLAIAVISIGNVVFAQDAKKPAAKTTKPKTTTAPPAAPKTEVAAPKEADGIHWLTLTEVQQKMKERPKKVFIDFYTGWCGWCKRMEATTFTNPALIKYMNNNFYALRFDAESKESFQFMGKEYHFEPQYKANTFAVELLKGQMGYPTSVFMMENFQNPTPIPGYHPVKEMEMFLLYYGDNVCMHQGMGEYQKTFVSAWDKGNTPDASQQPMH